MFRDQYPEPARVRWSQQLFSEWSQLLTRSRVSPWWECVSSVGHVVSMSIPPFPGRWCSWRLWRGSASASPEPWMSWSPRIPTGHCSLTDMSVVLVLFFHNAIVTCCLWVLRNLCAIGTAACGCRGISVLVRLQPHRKFIECHRKPTESHRKSLESHESPYGLSYIYI